MLSHSPEISQGGPCGVNQFDSHASETALVVSKISLDFSHTFHTFQTNKPLDFSSPFPRTTVDNRDKMGSQKKKTESKKGKGKGNDSTGPLTPREVELLRRIMASTNASSSSPAVVPLDYAELGKSYPGVNARTL